MRNRFLRGARDGLPIFAGYIAVGFAFGIYAVSSGITVLQSVLISMTNVTSAGQLAAVPIIVSGGTLAELALSQLVINMRYSLMSVSLSQKLDDDISLFDRFIIAAVNTDEVFAMAYSQNGRLSRAYMYGLILTPYIGWTAGTALGALAGNILPEIFLNSLAFAIYGMFIAIVVPPAKKDMACMFCVLIAVALSCAFYYMPLFSAVPNGFRIIICAVVASLVMAIAAPMKEAADNA